MGRSVIGRGVATVVDPYGRVQDRLARGAQATLRAKFTPLNDMTMYTRFGDWVVPLAMAVWVACCVQGVFMKRAEA